MPGRCEKCGYTRFQTVRKDSGLRRAVACRNCGKVHLVEQPKMEVKDDSKDAV